MYSKDITQRLCLVNASDRYFTVRKGAVIGEAVETHQVQLAVEKNPVSQSSKIPDHLKSLVHKSLVNLTENQQKQLEKIISEYADVFAENELHLLEISLKLNIQSIQDQQL